MATILMYHRIREVSDDAPKSNLYVSPAEFEEQIEYLTKKKYLFVSLNSIADEFQKKSVLPQNSVAITFDDTTLDNYKIAFPILKKYQIKATFFVIADRALGLLDSGNMKEYAAIEQIKEMANEEYIDIGSHSCTHPHLTDIDDTQLVYEIVESKKKLEEAIGRKVKFFSYPYGNFDDRVIKCVKSAKYLAAVSTIRDNRNRRKHLFFLKRVMVMRDVGIKHFGFYFTPLYHLEHYSKNKKLWGKYK